MTKWLISANPNMYDHAAAFAKWGYIDWIQFANYEVGDIIFIYASKQIGKILYKTEVITNNMSFFEIEDDSDFWFDSHALRRAEAKYSRLKLLEESDGFGLDLDSLRKHGLINAPQGAKKLNGELLSFIEASFDSTVVDYEYNMDKYKDSFKHVKRIGSKSDVQCKIEEYLINQFEQKYGLFGLKNNTPLFFQSVEKTYIVPDIYSEEHKIIGEVHAHYGKLRSGQKDKLSCDILKMILFDKDRGMEFEKHVIICGQYEKAYLEGNSYIAAAIRMFKVKVDYFDLPSNLIEELSDAVKQQNLLG